MMNIRSEIALFTGSAPLGIDRAAPGQDWSRQLLTTGEVTCQQLSI